MDLKVGDSVQQKSGGTIMTVETLESSLGGKVYVSCVWIEGTNLQHRTFPANDLMAARPIKSQ